MVRWEGRHNRDLLEELARTEMALNSYSDSWAELCPKNKTKLTHIYLLSMKKGIIRTQVVSYWYRYEIYNQVMIFVLKVAAVRRHCRAGVTSVAG